MVLPTPAYAHPTRRNVACTDGLKRPRHLSTWIASDRVVLVAPPAETAVMTPEAARELAIHLVEQAISVEAARYERDVRNHSVIGLRRG